MTSDPVHARCRPAWTINGRFLLQPLTGVQRFGRELLIAMDECFEDQSSKSPAEVELLVPPGAHDVPPLKRIRVRQTKFGSGHLWDQLLLPLHVRGGLVGLANFGPLALSNQIICIHDVNTFLAPESYSRSFRTLYRTALPLLARRARRVATVSHFSADMLVRFGICEREKIFVLWNGHEHALRWRESRASEQLLKSLPRPFVLLLGSRAKHKNIDIVLRGAPALDAAGIDVAVVGSASRIFADEGMQAAAPNVRFLDHVGDDDLAMLFAKALCFVWPSRAEGFGLPLLEAMTRGCPVMSSTAASMPEVGGDAVIYGDPYEASPWVEGILRLSRNETLRRDLIAKGHERAKLFSWKRSARILIKEMQALALSHRLGAARADSRYTNS